MSCHGTGGNGGGAQAMSASPIENQITALAYGIPQDQQSDLYYHSGLKSETVDKMTDAERESYAKTEAITVNEPLPAIESSSQAQHDYAWDVRSKALLEEIETAKKLIPSDKEKKANVMQNAKNNLGIETYSDLVLYLAKNRPNSLWDKITSTTKAQDIISKKWASNS